MRGKNMTEPKIRKLEKGMKWEEITSGLQNGDGLLDQERLYLVDFVSKDEIRVIEQGDSGEENSFAYRSRKMPIQDYSGKLTLNDLPNPFFNTYLRGSADAKTFENKFKALESV